VIWFALFFRDLYGVRTSAVGLSYTLRIGFGVTSRWLVFLGALYVVCVMCFPQGLVRLAERGARTT